MTTLRSLLAPWQQTVRAFFRRRAPKSQTAQLGLHNVYIFFSRQGILFAFLLLITFIMGVNYGNNLVLGLFFYLFGIWLVSVFYTFVQVSSLSLRFVEASLAQAGDFAWITLEVSSRSRASSRQIRFDFEQISANRSTAVVMTNITQNTLVRLPVYVDRRGCHALPRLTIQSVYPLGIMRAWAYVYFDGEIFAYPKAQAFDWNQPTSLLAQGAQASLIGVVGQEDFDRLDSYVQGESLARVSWTHVARGSGLLTKYFFDPVGQDWCLDYEDMPSSHHEQKLAQLVFAISQVKELGVPFRLKLPNFHGQMGMGEAFVQQNLQQIAKMP